MVGLLNTLKRLPFDKFKSNYLAKEGLRIIKSLKVKIEEKTRINDDLLENKDLDE